MQPNQSNPGEQKNSYIKCMVQNNYVSKCNTQLMQLPPDEHHGTQDTS